ncbi:MAG: hypothetical protein KatS3mg110_4621 [Pirellulaceae bacterium]|nr:MAG: hypothetical protein KatS3mg110_4621 [Pirellulaceae bacterium]
MRKSYGGTLARSALRLPLPPKPISFSLFANRERLRIRVRGTLTSNRPIQQVVRRGTVQRISANFSVAGQRRTDLRKRLRHAGNKSGRIALR